MQKSKKIAIGVLTLSLVAATAIGGTLAFLTDAEKVTNTFDIADLDITIAEPNWDEDEAQDLTPGDTLYKDPTVTAVENDSYMRVIVKIIDTTDSSVIEDEERLGLILDMIRYDSSYNAESNPITTGISTDSKYTLAQLENYSTVNGDFTKDDIRSSNGVYYYNYTANNGVFEVGTDVVLFTNIVVPSDYTNEQIKKIGQFQIEVYAQAIQTENFNSAAEAFAALDDEITAGTLQESWGTVGGINS